MSGQAIAGTLASAAQLAAIYLDRGTSREGESLDVYGQQALAVDGYWRLRLRTAMYFLASAIFLVFSTLAWAQLNARLALPSAVARNRLEQDSYAPLATSDNVASHANETNQPSSVSALVAPMREDSPRLTRADRTEFPSTPESGPTNLHIRPVPPLLTELEDLGSEEATAPTPTSEANVESGEVSSSWLTQFGLSNAQQLYRTFAEVSPFVYICAIVMGQTLAVFPPLTEAIVSSPYSSPRISNLSAWHFFLFNASDYLGRLSTQWLSCSSPKILHGINGARTLLIPAFLMFPTLATSPQAAFVVHSDILFLLLVLVLGWSNGWVATTALIAGPRLASDKETAGSILGFALCVGLVIGAAASYPVLLIAGIS
ncbi:hypothetical protein GGI04_002656 [Coemansia thaxteri]|nr:hypothetical protein GGI04_002656 [Coemansia thaxteri]